LALLVYGAAIEALQGITPHRSADLFDLLADVIGLAMALLLASSYAWIARMR
jgi:VanZ family protein